MPVLVGLLLCIKKESKLNVLTRSWASFILFFVIELVALGVVLFGGCSPPSDIVRPIPIRIVMIWSGLRV